MISAAGDEKMGSKTVPSVALEKQTLEEFYASTEGHYPAHLPKFPARQRSAPAQKAPRTRPSSHTLHSRSLVMTSAEPINYNDVIKAAVDSNTAPLKVHV